jgi:hypothetical protein
MEGGLFLHTALPQLTHPHSESFSVGEEEEGDDFGLYSREPRSSIIASAAPGGGRRIPRPSGVLRWDDGGGGEYARMLHYDETMQHYDDEQPRQPRKSVFAWSTVGSAVAEDECDDNENNEKEGGGGRDRGGLQPRDVEERARQDDEKMPGRALSRYPPGGDAAPPVTTRRLSVPRVSFSANVMQAAAAYNDNTQQQQRWRRRQSRLSTASTTSEEGVGGGGGGGGGSAMMVVPRVSVVAMAGSAKAGAGERGGAGEQEQPEQQHQHQHRKLRASTSSRVVLALFTTLFCSQNTNR